MQLKKSLLAILILPLLLSSTYSQAQEQASQTAAGTAPEEAAQVPEDALNRGTPRGSINGYLEATARFDYPMAAEYLDLSDLPANVEKIGGPELARQLNLILTRSVWFDDHTVSDDPEGLKGDGLPIDRDQLVVINSRRGDVELWMQRIPRGDGEQIWKVSNRSVALVPELYDEFSYSPWVETVRGWFPDDVAFLGVEAFKWFILLMIIAVCWPIYTLIGRLLVRFFSAPERDLYPFVRKTVTGPLVALAIVLTMLYVLRRLGVGAYAQEVMQAKTLLTLVIVWTLWTILNLFRNHEQQKLEAQGRAGAAKLMRPLIGLVKIIVLIMGLLFWLNNLGVNITTVLAGLGVGGLAVALALQKPLEDMVGALTIFSQAPIRVGDFCQYGEFTGTVEDIGLRTIRLRTPANTLVSIPNSRFAYVEIENFTSRTMIRFWPKLRLEYNTRPEQLRRVIDDIHAMLLEHEQVHDAPLRVRFTDFDEYAILVSVHSFIKTTDFAEFLEVSEELNFRIMEIVRDAGVRFADKRQLINP